ncbi:DMT family transporter [Pararhizobium sp.]|uniref:DMT family transporter n=1 Tax=Pararhizobium sp. TaxID=1977563 RepID=UPI00271AB6F4|nr:DMT family transporter [Pararhizobium sp.]MDO9414762.1 DMT family transporter [Pararhizobium sp.]
MRSAVGLGILLTSLAYALFTFHDAAIKWMVVALPVSQILFIRSLTILTMCLAAGRGTLIRRTIASPIKKPMLLRSFLLFSAWLSYYNAARTLPLAELTTLYYAAPIMVTILSIPILKEVVPLHSWAAVVVGFIGVFIACNPVGIGLSWPVYLALQAAVLWSFSVILLRKSALDEITTVQMVISNGLLVIYTGVMLPFEWAPISPGGLSLLVGTGVVAGLAQYALFEGMRRAPVSVLAPFEYSSLVWAFLLGFLIWGDIPRPGVFIGAALIFAAGMIIVIFERWRRPVLPAPAPEVAQ